MKKGIALLVSCMLLFVLAACGGGQKESQGDSGITDTAVAEAELVIKGTNFQFDQKEYRLKKGVPVKITYENEDGNHGVMIPVLGLSLDRKNNSKVVTPEKTGEFEISCSIMCGAGHSKMISKLIVEE